MKCWFRAIRPRINILGFLYRKVYCAWKKRLSDVDEDINTKVFIEGAYAVILKGNALNETVILHFEGIQ